MSTDTVTTPSSDFEGFKGRAVAALKGMELLRKTLEQKIDELDQIDAATKPSDLINLQKELGKAVTVATEQEGKLADALRVEHGGDGIDLDLARAEIGRRLDRIRDAEDASGVS